MKNKQGFSLLELLVVVLIIAILTAIALPQYRILSEKSRAIEGQHILKTVAQAQERYYMDHGTFATQFADLDLDVPWTGTGGVVLPWRLASNLTDHRANEYWTIRLESGGWITIVRNNGDYPKCGFGINLAKDSDKKIKCLAFVDYGPEDQSYCTNLFSSAQNKEGRKTFFNVYSM